jgi:hypothetical protein
MLCESPDLPDKAGLVPATPPTRLSSRYPGQESCARWSCDPPINRNAPARCDGGRAVSSSSSSGSQDIEVAYALLSREQFPGLARRQSANSPRKSRIAKSEYPEPSLRLASSTCITGHEAVGAYLLTSAFPRGSESSGRSYWDTGSAEARSGWWQSRRVPF